jgi:hypothetical protein
MFMTPTTAVLSTFSNNITRRDQALPQTECSFNNFVSRSIGCIPFEVVYGFPPHTPLDLNSLPLPPRPSKADLDFSSYIRDVQE